MSAKVSLEEHEKGAFKEYAYERCSVRELSNPHTNIHKDSFTREGVKQIPVFYTDEEMLSIKQFFYDLMRYLNKRHLKEQE